MRFFVLVLGAVVLCSAAFGLSQKSDKPAPIPPAAPGASATAPRAIKENVVAYHTADAGMNAAKQKARDTLPRFRQLMANGAKGTYTVKFPLTQNGETEHIWLQINGAGKGGEKAGEFFGRLANDPVNGTKYKRGDWMKVAAADVEDWMVNDGGEIYGGYTARVAISQMPREQQAKYKHMFKD